MPELAASHLHGGQVANTWQKRHPEHQPLKCSSEHHLWRQGLALAIYVKAGTLTNGGENPFTASQVTLAKFFDSHLNSIGNAMNFLRKHGWLVPGEKADEYKYVSHTDWVAAHAGHCVERKIVPYGAL
jgi:hypothetical protein